MQKLLLAPKNPEKDRTPAVMAEVEVDDNNVWRLCKTSSVT